MVTTKPAKNRPQPSDGRLRRLASIWRDRRGAALPILVMGMLPAIGALGGAVDYSRMHLVRMQLQTAVDAAALAGARAFEVDDDSTGDRDIQANAYVSANFTTGYMGTRDLTVSKSFTVRDKVNVTTVRANTIMPMAFMQIFGITPMTITAVATAELSPKPLEIMVVLDNTGSMQEKLGTGNRMDALKAAMTGFVDLLHQGASSRDELAMGIVTYNVTTNVGAILKKYNVKVADSDGFTNVGTYTGGGDDFPTNPLGWKGCVNNDATIPDLNNDKGGQEAGAWDLTKSLPGEGMHPPVTPYHYMPNMVSTAAYKANVSGRSAVANEYTSSNPNTSTADTRRNNLYRLAASGEHIKGNRLANTAAYRQHFYDMYIGLNADTTNIEDDVIVTPAGGYFAPGSGTWAVDHSRIPRIASTVDWAAPNPKYGYPTRAGSTLKMATPNFQCPEPSLELAYGRDRSVYDNFIRDDNYPVMPASGTLHHIGLLWGYRLLTRSDIFTRPRSGPRIVPRRAMVFMTDGEANAGVHVSFNSAYGAFRERKITRTETNASYTTQTLRRFARVCEAAKRDSIDMYVVSLVESNTVTRNTFRDCAGARFKETSSQAEIKKAFQEIAADLVELHLVQ